MILVAVVVTYFPDIEDTIKNISQYIEFVDKLIIWENTPISERDKYKILFPNSDDKIVYLGTNKNEGMSYALNRSVEWALENKYTHILTMDQDSYFTDFSRFLSIARKYFETKDVGIITSNPNYKIEKEAGIVSVNDCITSGTIHDIDLFKKIGLFREEFFIDAVDIEFCYRTKVAGYKILLIANSLLKQRYGNYTKTIFGFSTPNYSELRTYCMIRNYIVLWREFPDLFSFKDILIRNYIIYRLIMILLSETKKYNKLRAVFWGINDGLRSKFLIRKFLYE